MSFRRLAAWSGIVAVVLLLLSTLIIGEAPPMLDDPAEEVNKYFVDNHDRLVISQFLATLAAPFVILFFVGLWWRNRDREMATGEPWSVVGIIGLAAAAGVVGAGTGALSAAILRSEETGAGRAYNDLSVSTFVFTGVLIATVLVSFSIAMVRGGTAPPWLAWLGYLGAALGILGSAGGGTDNGALGFMGFLAYLVFIVWVLATSIVLVRQEATPAAAPAP